MLRKALQACKHELGLSLENVPLGDAPLSRALEEVNPPTLISVQAEETVGKTLELMQKNKILSVPVFEHEKCIGLFSVELMISYLGKLWTLSEWKNLREENYHRIRQLFGLTVGYIVCLGRDGPSFVKVDKDTPLSDVLELFASGLQRFMVFKRKHRHIVSQIVTQSTIISYIVKNPSCLDGWAHVPVKGLGTPWDRVIKVRADAPLVLALLAMRPEHVKIGVSCTVTVVGERHLTPTTKKDTCDECSKSLIYNEEVDADHSACWSSLPVLGHLSPSDFIPYFTHETEPNPDLNDKVHEPLLTWTVLSYLNKIRKADGHDPNHIVTLPSHTTLLQAMQVLLEKHIHQVYIQDEADTVPTHLITMTAICHKLYSVDA